MTRFADEAFLLLIKGDQAAMQESGQCSTQRTGEVVPRTEVLIDEANSTWSSDVRVGYVWQTPQHVTYFGGIGTPDSNTGISGCVRWRRAPAKCRPFEWGCRMFCFDKLLHVTRLFVLPT